MNLAKLLMVTGLIFLGGGIALYFLQKIPGAGKLGQLPGDIHWRGKNVSFHFPIATSLLLSLLLSLILYLVGKSRG